MIEPEHLDGDDLASYAEHSAEPARLPAIEAHLRTCHGCLRELVELRTLLDLEHNESSGLPHLALVTADPCELAVGGVVDELDERNGELVGRDRDSGPDRDPPRTAGASLAPPRASWRWSLAAGAVGAATAMAAMAIVQCARPSRGAPAAAVPAPPSGAEHVVRLCGSDTIGAKLMPELVEAFLVSTLHCASVSRTPRTAEQLSRGEELSVGCRPPNWPSVRVAITALGTEDGIHKLARGSCDIAMASRQITEDEARELAALWGGDASEREHVIGLNGITVIANEDNPVSRLDAAALAAIFSGATTSWKTINGIDRPIHVYALDDRSGTFKTFQQVVLGESRLGPARRDSSNEKLADLVAADIDGISFIGAPHLRGVKALALAEPGGEELYPTVTAIRTEDYLLSRRLYLYGPRARDEVAADLIAFATSDAGQAIVAGAGFIDLRTHTIGSDSCAHCASEYRALTENAHRVRVNLRFVTGTTTLDDLGRRDLAWLATEGKRDLRGKHVLVLGFTDDQGDPQANQRLAEQRAAEVAAKLPGAPEVKTIRAVGFGVAMPIGSNRDERGQHRNRRVEVWVK